MAVVVKMFAMSGIKIIKSKAEIMEETGMSLRTVDSRLAEIREEMKPGGRYEGLQYVIGGNGKFAQVNYLVWVDHEMNRGKLQEKNLRKLLKPYNPAQVAKEMALYADKELALEGIQGW